MRKIERVAVLGSGVMGATIAAHLANAGLNVLLLDILPRDLDASNPKDRNRLATGAIASMAKMKPAPFFSDSYASRLEPGNFEDHASKLKECDWVIEVVIENMEIKKQVYANLVVPNLSPGAYLSSNTSGLSINEMAEGLPEEVRKNFLVTHFFNPPRYMRLMEIVPCQYTDPQVMKHLADFLSHRLGKGVVYGKDTTNFIANRIGVFAIYNSIRHMQEMQMTVEEVDAIAGPATARPKSAAFRTADLVGLDTLVHVGENSYNSLPNDEQREVFKTPDFIKAMVENKLLGNKTKGGFYKKSTGPEGKKEIFFYDYTTGQYKPSEKPKFASVASVKQVDDPRARIKMLVAQKDKAALFAWKNLRDSLIYTLNRIPEIADDVVNVDNAMKWGFNWEIGPFEMLDALGVKNFVERCQAEGVALPAGLEQVPSFYKYEGGKKLYFDLLKNAYQEVPQSPSHVDLEVSRRSNGVVEKNGDASIHDLKDGVFLLEFHSKMNSITGGIISMLNKAIARAEQEGKGLVIANRGANFSVGANLMLLAATIAEQEWDDVALMVKAFQQATMKIKYSKVPVVVAPFNMALGGGCEFALHADARVAYAETYMGLVEVGVGLLPGGGGTKEMSLRAIQQAQRFNTDVTPFLFKNFQQIGTAQVSFSADMLYDMGYLVPGDSITMNLDNLIHDAKLKVLALAANYRPQSPLVNLPAPGRGVAASIKSQLWNMAKGGFATEYEAHMGGIIADVMAGGDVPAGTLITEEYLLDIEREGFLKLCGNPKTLQRIQHTLKTGKPLRN